MPLHMIENTGNPYIRFQIEENTWSISSETGLEDVDLKGQTILIDIAEVKMGWLALQGGRDWLQWPGNNPVGCDKPSDAHKQGFSVTFYSTKLFGDSPSRELSSSQIGMLDFVKALYMAAETNPKFKTHVPKVKIGEAPKRKVGKGSTRTPGFEITGWADRPEELGGALPVPSAAAVTAPAAAASDDVSFGDEI